MQVACAQSTGGAMYGHMGGPAELHVGVKDSLLT